MKKLSELFDQLGDGNADLDRAYDQARAAKVGEIAEYLRDHIKDPDDAERIAEYIMSRAEEVGQIDGDDVSGEVPGRDTASGNPLVVTV